jgi:hypothetical protein
MPVSSRGTSSRLLADGAFGTLSGALDGWDAIDDGGSRGSQAHRSGWQVIACHDLDLALADHLARRRVDDDLLTRAVAGLEPADPR